MKYEFINNNGKKTINKNYENLTLLSYASRFLILVICFLIPVTCSLSAAHGALIRSLNDLNIIEAEVSCQGLTRITVEDDRILNVFGITGEYVLETDEDQGQIFLRPMGLASLNPISLTLTTEKGHTQDLRLSPKDKAPEALILQAEEPSQKKLAQDFPNQNEVETLIQACQEDRIPVGYKSMPLDIKPQKGPQRLIGEICSSTLKGLTYEVRNTSQIPLIMAEQSLAKTHNVIAVYMPLKLLNPGEKAHVYVVEKVTE